MQFKMARESYQLVLQVQGRTLSRMPSGLRRQLAVEGHRPEDPEELDPELKIPQSLIRSQCLDIGLWTQVSEVVELKVTHRPASLKISFTEKGYDAYSAKLAPCSHSSKMAFKPI